MCYKKGMKNFRPSIRFNGWEIRWDNQIAYAKTEALAKKKADAWEKKNKQEYKAQFDAETKENQTNARIAKELNWHIGRLEDTARSTRKNKWTTQEELPAIEKRREELKAQVEALRAIVEKAEKGILI